MKRFSLLALALLAIISVSTVEAQVFFDDPVSQPGDLISEAGRRNLYDSPAPNIPSCMFVEVDERGLIELIGGAISDIGEGAFHLASGAVVYVGSQAWETLRGATNFALITVCLPAGPFLAANDIPFPQID